MLDTPCHIVSDLHLGVAPAATERLFERYLERVGASARTLIVNGDLFDFWFEWKTVIPRRGFRVLAALAAVRESGVRLVWIAGNHDCWGGEVLRDDVGAEYHLAAWSGTIGRWRARVEHGDGLRGAADRRYRAIRPVMRSPTAMRLFRGLHPDVATRIATGSSQASRTYSARDAGRGLRAVGAAHLAADRTLDLLVYGHSHVASLERTPTGGVLANAGSWLDAPTFLAVGEDRIELRRWRDGSAEGDRLDALDRRAEEAPADA